MAEIKVKFGLNDGENTIEIDRNKLTEVNSTSQMTAGPSGINYGSVSSTGSFTINDYNDEIKSKIDDGTLDVSGVSVSVYEDNHLIQRHISRDSDYNNADKTFSVSLTNKLQLLDTLKYKGYTYQDAPITVYVLLFDVLNNFYDGQLTSQDDVLYKDILSAYMIHPVTGQRIHIWEYAQDIVIKYPSIEYGRTYRDVIDELCTILQCYMYVNDNDDLVFASARPLLENGNVSNAIRITKDKMYSPLKDAVILRNKYDGIEIGEASTEEKIEENKELYVKYVDLSNQQYPDITPSDLYVQSSTLTNSSNYTQSTGIDNNPLIGQKNWANYLGYKNQYCTVTFSVPKKSNNGLNKILSLNDYIVGDNFAAYKNNYHKYVSILNATYNTSTNRFTNFTDIGPSQDTESGMGTYLTEYSNLARSTKIEVKDESTITFTETSTQFNITYKFLIGQQILNLNYLQDAVGQGGSWLTGYWATSAYLSVLGKELQIVFTNSSASSTNIDSAKTVASVQTGKLIQNVTQVGSTSAGSYNDGTKITTIIKDTILDDYTDGISTATVTVCCDDFFDANGTKVIDWSQGQTLQVGQLVFFSDDKYSDGSQRYWRITGRKFYWEGAPYCDLELQEAIEFGALPDGLYQNGQRVYTYQELIDGGYMTVSGNTLTSFDKTLTGQLVLYHSDITAIGDEAFYDHNVSTFPSHLITSVVLPKHLTSIGFQSFAYSSITSMEIPNGVTNIGGVGGSAFDGCANLEEINIPTGTDTIMNGTFMGCTSLEAIYIPKNIETIAGAAFYACTSLESVEFEEDSGLTTLGQSCFGYCTSLDDVILPSSVTNIEKKAFGNCSSLKTLTLYSTTPPTLENTNAIPSTIETIYIPQGTLSAYQSATNWSSFSAKFVEMTGAYYNYVDNGTLHLDGSYTASQSNSSLYIS